MLGPHACSSPSLLIHKMMELLETAESGSVGTAMKVASQRDIVKQADVQTVQKKFELNLEMGPYKGRI